MFTGAKVYNPDTVERDSKGNPIFVTGIASKVVVSDTSTTLSVKEVPSEVLEAAQTIKSKEVQTQADKDRLKRLIGKSCIIEVGGLTPNDIREKYDRVDDALASVKSAISEGYIPGGGSTLVFISNLMRKKFANKDEQRGYNLVKTVLRAPMLQILKNANRKNSRWGILGTNYLKHSEGYFGVGYNASTDEISNLNDDGIIDSKKSIRVALESASESAIKMFNTGVIVHYPK
jgi:chaperonin GroEL